tara:strand:- start:11463 stop:11645 length:183 start_codon:yes stop_codon:yes gene_type:complete
MLTSRDLLSLAKAVALDIKPEDIEDVLFGVNGLLEAIKELPTDQIATIEPLSTTDGGQND